MLIRKISETEVQITLTSVPDAKDGAPDEVQTVLRALRIRKDKCAIARGVRVGRYVPEHGQALNDLPILEELVAGFKEHGIEEFPPE